MAGYRNEIANFLRSKGLNDYAVAGFLGNFMVESGFDPTSANGAEGAIGFANWEGGRRDALRQWALTHYGAQETDAMSQLTFLWHELTTSYSSVLQQLQNVTSAGEAAAIIDAHYEVSSGAARQQRIDYANQFYTGSGPNPSYNGPLSSNGSTGGSSGGSGGNPTRADYSSVDSLGNLLNSIPELRKLVDQATSNDWTLQRFQNAVENSDWYKDNSAAARAAIVTRANDPATWQQSVQTAESAIDKLSRQLGMALTPDEVHAIAVHAIFSGNDTNQAWLTNAVSNHQDYSNLKSTDNLRGGMAGVTQQLQQMAADYGMNWSPSDLAVRAQKVLDGSTTIDTFHQQLIDWAKSTFPGLTAGINGGQTVRQLADPYVQSMSQLLELDPGTLNLYTPSIRKALQGVSDPKTKERVPLTVSSFEDQVRQDPRWGFTQNAKDTMSQALVQVGSVWGFGPEG